MTRRQYHLQVIGGDIVGYVAKLDMTEGTKIVLIIKLTVSVTLKILQDAYASALNRCLMISKIYHSVHKKLTCRMVTVVHQ
jgi:predicted membrane channel-forming protein YqfA (hemolysin III family)